MGTGIGWPLPELDVVEQAGVEAGLADLRQLHELRWEQPANTSDAGCWAHVKGAAR